MTPWSARNTGLLLWLSPGSLISELTRKAFSENRATCVLKSEARRHEYPSPGRHTYRPVIVDVTQLVREPLYVVRLQATAVVDDVIVCGRNTATSHSLAHDKKIIPGIIREKPPGGEAYLSESGR